MKSPLERLLLAAPDATCARVLLAQLGPGYAPVNRGVLGPDDVRTLLAEGQAGQAAGALASVQDPGDLLEVLADLSPAPEHERLVGVLVAKTTAGGALYAPLAAALLERPMLPEPTRAQLEDWRGRTLAPEAKDDSPRRAIAVELFTRCLSTPAPLEGLDALASFVAGGPLPCPVTTPEVALGPLRWTVALALSDHRLFAELSPAAQCRLVASLQLQRLSRLIPRSHLSVRGRRPLHSEAAEVLAHRYLTAHRQVQSDLSSLDAGAVERLCAEFPAFVLEAFRARAPLSYERLEHLATSDRRSAERDLLPEGSTGLWLAQANAPAKIIEELAQRYPPFVDHVNTVRLLGHPHCPPDLRRQAFQDTAGQICLAKTRTLREEEALGIAESGNHHSRRLLALHTPYPSVVKELARENQHRSVRNAATLNPLFPVELVGDLPANPRVRNAELLCRFYVDALRTEPRALETALGLMADYTGTAAELVELSTALSSRSLVPAAAATEEAPPKATGPAKRRGRAAGTEMLRAES